MTVIRESILCIGTLCAWAMFNSQASAQVHRCVASDGSVSYQQETCAKSSVTSKTIERKVISLSERIADIDGQLKMIDKTARESYPDVREVFGQSRGYDSCRKTAGIRSSYDLLFDWVPPRPDAFEKYERCVKAEVLQDQARIDKSRAESRASSEKDRARLSLPYPTVGMSAHQVRAGTMLGSPKSVKSTTTALGRREQWVYDGGTYLYFDNGVLTTIQSR